MSFYRTYRPQIISEIDNISVRESLLALLSKSKKDLPHAYLFSGPRGAGKTTAARVIAKMFNCEKSTKEGPCGTCEQCITISEGRNLDVLELDAASNRGIDEIRTLKEGIGLAPVAGAFKVYIIDEVHMLTTEAFNALLKTLEEPPTHAIFVLATTDPQKVPVTIASRCMGFVFSKATSEELTHALGRIVKKEKIAIDDEALMLLSQSVDGSFRDGVKLLEQASFHKGKITREILEQLLSLTSTVAVTQFMELLAKKDASAALAHISGMAARGADFKGFLTQCLAHLEASLVAHVEGAKTAGVWHEKDISMLIRKLSQAYGEMKITPIPQLPLELAIVEYCSVQHPVEKDKPTKESPVAVSVHVSTAPTPAPKQEAPPAASEVSASRATETAPVAEGLLTVQKLADHWADVIADLKPQYHSIAGVMRSTRPSAVKDGIVTIEAFYTFHKDKLSEIKAREALASCFKKLFGEKVKVEIVLGKK
jgi:DNA polymerase-3 subunit gamma/tau